LSAIASLNFVYRGGGRGRGSGGVVPRPLYNLGLRKVRISKLAQILPTGALDYIFDDSGEKNLWQARTDPYGGPKIVIFAWDMRL
jgi:hypothetical protein